jgi:hypothetical protein
VMTMRGVFAGAALFSRADIVMPGVTGRGAIPPA